MQHNKSYNICTRTSFACQNFLSYLFVQGNKLVIQFLNNTPPAPLKRKKEKPKETKEIKLSTSAIKFMMPKYSYSLQIYSNLLLRTVNKYVIDIVKYYVVCTTYSK